MCKFLFQGPLGTGKTESVRYIAQQLQRPLYYVDFTTVVNSKLGQTQKNLVALFQEIAQVAEQQQAIVIFDEIDALALERVGADDLREMGRVISILFRELDRVSKHVVIIATTNLFEHFDKALVRRFDSVVDFSRYSREDLLRAADALYNHYLNSFKGLAHQTRLFKKIITSLPTIPYPGDLKNLIRTSMAFSDLDSDTNYLARLYQATHPQDDLALANLKQAGFSLREIEILTGISN